LKGAISKYHQVSGENSVPEQNTLYLVWNTMNQNCTSPCEFKCTASTTQKKLYLHFQHP